MSTSTKTGRAWVPAIVTTLLAVVLLAASGLLREVLVDREVAALRDPDSLVGTYVYARLAPLGGPGLVGDGEFAESIAQLGGGLVPVVIVVFLFTWLAARSGSSFGVLMGAWLGTVLGTGLGAIVAFQVFVWQNDFADVPGVHQIRADRIDTGLYWGAVAGLLLGLVAMLARVVSRPRSEEPPPATPESTPPPPDGTSYPPPGKHQQPAGTPPEAGETVRRPETTQEP